MGDMTHASAQENVCKHFLTMKMSTKNVGEHLFLTTKHQLHVNKREIIKLAKEGTNLYADPSVIGTQCIYHFCEHSLLMTYSNLCTDIVY